MNHFFQSSYSVSDMSWVCAGPSQSSFSFHLVYVWVEISSGFDFVSYDSETSQFDLKIFICPEAVILILAIPQNNIWNDKKSRGVPQERHRQREVQPTISVKQMVQKNRKSIKYVISYVNQHHCKCFFPCQEINLSSAILSSERS